MSLFPAYDLGSKDGEIESSREEPRVPPPPTSFTSFTARDDEISGGPISFDHDNSKSRQDKKKSTRRSRSRSSSSERRKKKRRQRSRSRSRRRSRSRSRDRRSKRRRSSSSDSDRRRRRSRSRDKVRRRKKRSKSREEKKITTARPNKSELVAEFSAHKVFLDDVGIDPKYAFRKDTTGDKLLKSEKTLPKNKVAFFKTRIKGHLGCDYNLFRAREQKEVLRFYQKSYLRAFLKEDNLTLFPSTTTSTPFDLDDFIKISEDLTKQKSHSEDDPLQIHDESTIKYLESSSDSKPRAADDMSSESFTLHLMQLKTKEFNEKLRKNPENVQLWIDYVDFQDECLQDTEFGNSEKKKKKMSKNVVMKERAVIEKKLSILKSAIDKNPKDINLALKRLDLSRHVLEADVLDRQWRELLFLFPKNFELWQFYLRYITSTFTTFTLERALKSYRMCFSKLKQVQGESFLSKDRDSNLEDQMRIIFNECCQFLSISGFREKGLAMYQAMIEFNLFTPDFPGYYSSDDKLALFEPFWESGVARFGEKNALGWKEIMKKKQSDEDLVNSCNSNDIEDELVEKAGKLVDKSRLWLELELVRERLHFIPFRSSEEEAEDPDRCVSFEDISPFLFQFHEQKQMFHFILGYLNFLGLTKFQDDDFLPLVFHSDSFRANLGSDVTESDNVEWYNEVATEVLRKTEPNFISDPEYQEFCRNTFSQLSQILTGNFKTQIVRLWVRFEGAVLENVPNISEKTRSSKLKEIVKNLVALDSNNVEIYLEYALLLYKMSGFKATWKVLEPILISTMDTSKLDQLYLTALSILVQESIKNPDSFQKRKEAVWILILMNQGETYRPLNNVPKMLEDIEDAKNEWKNQITSRVLSNSVIKLEDSKKCLENPLSFVPDFIQKLYFCSIAIYFTEEGEDKVEEIFKLSNFVISRIKEVETKSLVINLILENVQKLQLDFLDANKWSEVKLARQVLSGALRQFPNSQVLFKNLKKFSIQPKVIDGTWRRLSEIVVDKTKSADGKVMYVQFLVKEFIKSRDLSQEDNADDFVVSHHHLTIARAMLEKLVLKEPGRYSIRLWRLLMWVTNMEQTVRSSQGRYQSVSTVFYRSIQECPAAKSLYLDVINYLFLTPEQSEQMKKVIDTLTEKGGRIRMPLEELDILLNEEEDHLEQE